MIKKLAVFLLGCLVIVIVVYVADLLLALIGLPGGVLSFARVIIAILALLAVVYLAWQAITGSPPP